MCQNDPPRFVYVLTKKCVYALIAVKDTKYWVKTFGKIRKMHKVANCEHPGP